MGPLEGVDRSQPVVYVQAFPNGENGEPIRLNIADRILSLKFLDNENKADELTLTLDNSDLALYDDPAFRKGMVLHVSWGYPGYVCPTRACVVTQIKGNKEHLELKALAKSVLLNTVTKTRTFENMRRSDVARKIAQEAGYGPAVQHIDETPHIIPKVVQSRTDAQFLSQLADQEGFTWHIDHEGFHFRKRDFGAAPLRVLRWYIAEGRGDELIDFQLDTDLLGKKGRHKVKGRDPLERQDFEAVADDSTERERDTLNPVLEVSDPSVLERVDEETGATDFRGTRIEVHNASEEVRSSSAANQAAAKREAQKHFDKAQHDAVRLKLFVVGDPGFMAKTVVATEGMGKFLSGRYYVKSVLTMLDSSGYKLELETVSNGSGGHSTESAVASGLELMDPKASGKQNEKPPKDGDELEPVEVVDEEAGMTRIEYRRKGA